MSWVLYVAIGAAVLIIIALVAMRSQGDETMASSTANRQLDHDSRPSPSVARRSNWLEGTQGTVARKTYHIGTRNVTIGRKVGNYIQLIDEEVSRVHAQVHGTSRGVELTDKGTQLGTKVNGEDLVTDVPTLLEDGDTVEIGGNAFLFHAQADFPTNHGLTEQKVAGQAQQRATAAMGQLDWKQEVAGALMKADGDKARAAEIMGVSPEIFEKMLKQAQQ